MIRTVARGKRAVESLSAAIAPIDRRTRIGRQLATLRIELVAHIGGSPSATQAAMIEQAIQLRARIAMMDAAFAAAGTMSAHDSRTYLAWNNSFTRLLRQLGLKGAAEKPPSLADYLAGKAAAA